MNEEVNNVSEQKEQEILSRGEISLILRDYEEIFSDFDPRSYAHRSLSFDFVDEARRATRDVDPSGFELRMLLPKSKRSIEKENMIKKRLKDHFKKHADLLTRESMSRIKRGFFLAAIGFLMMIFATYILHSERKGLGFDMLYVFFEPAGWFTVWTGLDLIFSFAREKNHDLDFYKKMSRANITFSHY